MVALLDGDFNFSRRDRMKRTMAGEAVADIASGTAAGVLKRLS